MEYSGLSRSEILELIKQQKAAILQTKIDMEPADNPQAQLIISELKTDLHELLTALQTTAHDRSHTLQHHTTNYELLLRQQSLRDATKSIRTFEPGSDVNRFITDLNKAYTIHVKPELREYPAMEKEFVKLAKQLLNEGIFQQMEDSRQPTSTFEELKAYLISTHGSQMTNFQYLSRAWDLQRHEGEKLTDFAGRLENTIREATVHITAKFKSDRQNAEMTAETAFSLMGAMLMSEKIKAWTPNIYPHLVKTMDRHYSAGGIASDAQHYLDRGIKTDITTAAETTALMASQPTHSDKPRSLESDKILADVQLQLLDLNKQLRQTHRRNPSIVDRKSRTAPTYNMKHNRAQRSAGQPSQQAMCKNLLRGRACFKGNRCPYFHPPHAQAHIATTDTGLPGIDSDQHNHEYATRFDELDFRLGPNEMWWLVPRSMYPLSIITHLTFKSDLISDRPLFRSTSATTASHSPV